ncbi:HlyD family type I secretion periplasmic adaptor subunit [Mesorhizobium sp. LjRoot246]|uniref:HlyD family type I secretion periplasmic adaptor subunit n=1 Tax=Mesorhizobium sp. LjRoot246 TaxID=3342294 RepID=UPI003ECD02AC
MSNISSTDRSGKPRTGYRTFLVVGLAAFLVLFGGVFFWMAYASISGAVIASGSIIVRGKPKLVQHLDGGIIKEILVKNGDLVKAGDVLVRLDETLLDANVEIYRNRLREGLARKARLEAERDGADSLTFDETILHLTGIDQNEGHRHGQERLFHARRMSRTGQIEQQREKISQFGNQITGVQGMVKSKREQLGYVVRELNGIKKLRDQGLAAETRVMAQEARRADLEGQIAESQADLARIENSIRETDIAILQIDREFQEQVLSELREVSTQVDDLVQQILATNKQLERIEIRAPVNGIVHELNVYTIGGVVPPGGTLMQLIAIDQGLDLEVNVEPRSIDQLHAGHKALIRFPAFNQRTTPQLFGSIDTISPSTIVNEKTGVAFYRVGIIVSPEEIAKLGDLALMPGMPAEAFIETSSRTVLDFIFKPLSDSIRHAFREQ